MSHPLRRSCLLLGLLLGPPLTGCGGSSSSHRKGAPPKPWWVAQRPATPRPGAILHFMGYDYVQLNGYGRRFSCTGKGSPTVLLESGGGDTLSVWETVQSHVEDVTRVCSYDRLTRQINDRLPPHRTSQDFVHELHLLLQKTDVVGPYVVVGHSLGGLNMQLYAATYPREVAGMVLVDSDHPDLLRKDRPFLSPRQYTLFALQQGPNPENLDAPRSLAQARRFHSLDHRPLIVLTAGRSYSSAEQRLWHLTRQQLRQLDQVWNQLQNDLAHRSSNSVHVLAKESSHYIQLDQPELVDEAIREVVRAIRTTTHRLPRCGKAFEDLGGRCLSSS